MQEALITGVLGFVTALVGFLLEYRYGHRLDVLDARVEAVEEALTSDD